jgi:hypothetical protein
MDCTMRLPALLHSFVALALLAAMAGCATPQYQTTVRLIPPADAQGRACVQDCEEKKTACQADCQVRYQACVRAVEPQVEARYIEALKLYELDLRHYAAELHHYELQLHFGWMHSHPYYGFYWWDPWPYFPPPYPPPPMPTREGVRAQLVKANCQDDCGCLPAYDTCFVVCGGQRVSETVCIKNCPPAK